MVFPKKWMFGPLLPPAQGAAGVVTQLWKCRKPRDCRLCPAPVECPRHARRLSAGPIATSLTPSAPPPPSPPLSLSLSHAPGGTPPPSPPAHREGRGKRGAVRCVDGLWRDSDGGPLPRRALPPRSRLRAYPGCALQTRWFITPNIQFSGRPTGAERGGGDLQGQGTAGTFGISCISTAVLQLPPPPGLTARAGQTSNFWERPMLPCLSDDRAIGAFWGCEGGAGSPRMIGSTNIRLRRDMGRFQGEVAFQRHQMLRERRGAGLRVRGPGVAAAAVGAEPQPRRGSGGARKRAPCGTEGPQEHAPARSRTPFLASPTPGPDRIPRLMHVGWQS